MIDKNKEITAKRSDKTTLVRNGRPATQSMVLEATPADSDVAGRSEIEKRRVGVNHRTDEEIAGIISAVDQMRAEGAALKDATRRTGITEQTYYQWKKRARPGRPAMAVQSAEDDLASLRCLEAENERLRRLLGEKLRVENADLRKRLESL